MEEAATIYYDVQGTATPVMKYERGNLLVPDHEYKNLTKFIALQSELTKFILAEVLEKDGVFSIAQSMKYKDQYGPERLARLL